MNKTRLLAGPLTLSILLTGLLSSIPVAASEPPAKAETSVPVSGDEQVKCVDPTACCEESKKVIELLSKLVHAYSKGDLGFYERHLDEKCTLFDEGSKKLTVGKAAVLDHLRNSFAEHAPGGPKPLVSLTIDQPYAKVHGDRCVVTFVATLKTGGPHPMTEQAHVTDVFVKRNGEWKKHYWQGKWEPVSDAKKSESI